MVSERTGKILNSIVREYIIKAMPVPSQIIASDPELGVSPATVRNEMAYLEQEGYLIRPHTSAGCIPSDKGYRYYVESIEHIQLPPSEERFISHIFHQVEQEVETWLSLTATLLARMAQNVAIVSLPRSVDCKLKHLELLALQESVVLLVVVLQGAKVKQKLITFDQEVSQQDLTIISNKLNAAYTGLTRQQISAQGLELSPLEKQATDHLLEMMEVEDEQEYEEPYLDGWHFMLNQPEFTQSERMLKLMELVDRHSLLKVMVPERLSEHKVHVIIGKENKDKAIQNLSVVISQYGLTDEAIGTIGVVGPTRMQYSRVIPTVYYMSSVLSRLVAGLYGRELRSEDNSE
ncbi:MAG: heat-inducible transcription repressor HrcA [Chloroflexi bacterium RBG_16_50_9]|nr:MAG: heat-inducible transcription repressor HrcA [Chloroflexi bacterium RBG_16_50_9]